ncbi:uncharacterized protein QC763_0045280 [Podospora pseudopauciseta]|uniref:Uncharacterized protein n=1 Tax=Podospora pseudopauciseta TaxID=2093780 RepID=A0ABR0HRH0_9PEZI|nr:hypothetical protein QC763_0045280 [Podospora pseudopauciseta]
MLFNPRAIDMLLENPFRKDNSVPFGPRHSGKSSPSFLTHISTTLNPSHAAPFLTTLDIWTGDLVSTTAHLTLAFPLAVLGLHHNLRVKSPHGLTVITSKDKIHPLEPLFLRRTTEKEVLRQSHIRHGNHKINPKPILYFLCCRISKTRWAEGDTSAAAGDTTRLVLGAEIPAS